MEPDNLEARVSALETQVRGLAQRVQASEQDAAAARVLAGAADRDVTEFHTELRDFRRATVSGFNALRDDMTDLRSEMRGKLEVAAAGQQHIVDLLERLIGDQG
ncbi:MULTISPECIES: hypothetical protein [Mycobacteriaceae]|uniref:Uncharacterized protein n=1 Tax=Mycolicibacterium novocastrense TaxID=59813 RepID=A0AAW5SQV7_MYCNV|nr:MULTISPECIES: hypothetical protein [Mycobacteriaceae]KUH94690.1 hypothetical protein AU189_17860 [Mycolicibacterium acapulense]KUH67861.1 hypothetical protein AU072_24880 [Mycolicibacterium novocastrense]KUH68334.1 hypothetical protein AU184_22810 [Mycolicibacterium novocastrense]KUH73413.1 hypothetical protein AU183_23700 [Mycolicibacterium novocastrense]KUI48632.1 hypothetical protein AU198_19160 [Mycobacterium sp. GA-1199]